MASKFGAAGSPAPNKAEIVPWDPQYTGDFVRINRLWIEDLFKVERHDIEQMEKVGNSKRIHNAQQKPTARC